MKMRKLETGFPVPDMTPTIGIVFLLFMFFMIAISFENTKLEERIKLPRDMLAKPPVIKPEHELVLNFGYPRLPSGARATSIPEIYYNQQYVDIGQITPCLEQEKRVIERIHGQTMIKDVTILIRADAEVPAGLVQELIKKCQEAGFTKFSLRDASEDV